MTKIVNRTYWDQNKKYTYRGFTIEIGQSQFSINGRPYYRADLLCDDAELAFAMRIINRVLGLSCVTLATRKNGASGA